MKFAHDHLTSVYSDYGDIDVAFVLPSVHIEATLSVAMAGLPMHIDSQ